MYGPAAKMPTAKALNHRRTPLRPSQLFVNYFAGTNHRAHEIRNEKVHHVQRALKKPEMFGPDEGDLLVVGWGSAKGAVDEGVNLCRAEGFKVSGLHMKIVYPLPLMLKDIFAKFKKVVTVEVA